MSFPFWLAAALLSLPMMFMFHVVTIGDPNSIFYNKTVCESRFRDMPLSHRQAFLTSMSILHVFAPCVIICVGYVRIFMRIAQEEGGFANLHPESVASGAARIRRINSPTLSRAKVKTLKMTVVIVTTFVVCGLPYHVLEMLFNFWHHANIPKLVSAILGALPIANSVINPYIFLLFTFNKDLLADWYRSPNRDSRTGVLSPFRNRSYQVKCPTGYRLKLADGYRSRAGTLNLAN